MRKPRSRTPSAFGAGSSSRRGVEFVAMRRLRSWGNLALLGGVCMGVFEDQALRQVEGVDAAFERFVVRVSPLLLRAAFLLTGDRGHAEDLTQMALLRVYQRWEAIDSSPEAYAREVLVNLTRDRWRTLARRPQEAELEAGGGVHVNEALPQLAERDTVVRAVRRLPRRQREVVALRFFLDLSVAQTAVTLGITEGAVKAYAARALARLRGLLEVDAPAQQKARSEVSDAH
jgi:RNA polymerase sigma-70 factor (sigma-E family)